jgi:hypothetical protein
MKDISSLLEKIAIWIYADFALSVLILKLLCEKEEKKGAV